MKILLIDDEQSLIDIFTQTFKTAGFEVVGAESGNEGILKAQTEHPDLIFLDQVLPDINGNQVLQMLKQDVETKDIPVAMLSNFNQDGMVRDAINLGAVDYILKYQIDPQDLIGKANQIMRSHTTLADKLDQSTISPTPPETQPLAQTPTTVTPPPAQDGQTPQASQPMATVPIQPPVAQSQTTMPTPSSSDSIGVQPEPTPVSDGIPMAPTMTAPTIPSTTDVASVNQIDPMLQSKIDEAIQQTPPESTSLESIINPLTPQQPAQPLPIPTTDPASDMPTPPLATESKPDASLPPVSPAATPLPTMPDIPSMPESMNQTSPQPTAVPTTTQQPEPQLQNPVAPLAQNGVVTPIPPIKEEPTGVTPEQPANNAES